MEWFNQINSIVLRTIIVYVGAGTLIALTAIVLINLILGFLELVLPSPKMWLFNKDNTSKKVRKFPFEDSKFYHLMLDMSIGDKALITIKRKHMASLSHLLICRLVYGHPSDEVTVVGKKPLISKKMEGKGKYLITSTSYGEKDWTLEFHEGEKKCEYVLTCINPSTAEAMRW